MSRIPGLYPISVAVLAGLAGWAAYAAGKGPSTAEQVLASRPKPTAAKEAAKMAPARKESQVLDLRGEIERMTQRDLSQLPNWVQLAEWEKIRSLSLPQVKEAMQLVTASSGRAPVDVLKEMLFGRWAELDPEEAMAAVADQEGEPNFSTPGRLALWTWLHSDAEAARRWGEKNPELAKALAINPMIADLLLKEPPDAALEKAAMLGADVHRSTMLYLTTTMAMNEASHAEFLKLLEKFPENQRQSMLEHFAGTWCASDPAKGLDGLKELIPDEGVRTKLRDRALKRWGRSQPGETLAWMNSHPQEADSGQQASVWREWVDNRPEDAMAWLGSRREDAGLAEAIVRHLQSYGSRDPLSRPLSAARQAEGLRRSYEIWSQAEPEEAARWLMSADPKIAATIKHPPSATQ